MSVKYKVWVHLETIVHEGTPDEILIEDPEPVDVGEFNDKYNAENLVNEISNFAYLKKVK